ncbi:MAG: S1 RNA-binding domain-containing protein [Bacillota bacterium]
MSSSEPVEVGNVVEGVVTGITNFGAFVELPNGKTGLVHISEVADAYVHEVSDYVQQNDRVKVKVLSISENGEKIALSLRQGNPGPPEFVTPSRPAPSKGGRRGGGGGRSSFEDKMQAFMKESEEKVSEFRRNRNNRRGGREPRK